jgi:hypothetical protein
MQTATARQPTTFRLRPRARATVLAIHIIVSVGWIGLDAGILLLGVTGLSTSDSATMRAVYVAAGIISDLLIPVSLASLLSGLALSVGTPWKLTRYRWVLLSFLLTTVMTVLVLFLLEPMLQQAADRASAGPVSTLTGATIGRERTQIVIAPVVALALLSFVTVINVAKPWGRIRRRAG